MPRFSANLGYLWKELPLIERLERSAAAGFRAVELHSPFDTDPGLVRDACARLGLALLNINSPRGDDAVGDVGMGAIPGREAEFQDSIDLAIAWARTAGATGIHTLAGKVRPIDQPAATATWVENFSRAADKAAKAGLTILVEPLGPGTTEGYFYSTIGRGSEMLVRIGRPNVKLMFDVFHVGVVEGSVLSKLECYMPWIGHVQIAAVPSRAEPDEGEINYRSVFSALDRLGYAGWVGAEYRPRTTVEEGLAWVGKLGVKL